MTSLRVLVVDDDPLLLEMMIDILNDLKVNKVTTCEGGATALARIDSGERYEVLLLDLNMPGMDGIEVLRNLSQRQYGGALVLLSGEDSRILNTAQRLAHAQNLRVLGSLAKPVTAEQLHQKLLTLQPASGGPSKQPIEQVPLHELLTLGIGARQITPYYQPQVRITDGRVSAVEVLARWHHPKRGWLMPASFIGLAEEQGLIDELSWVVFDKAISQLGKWLQNGYDIAMGLNLSSESLTVVNLPERIDNLVRKNNVPPNHITLEITETRLMQNLTYSLDVLTRLRLKGFGLSIDDFGTGYSTMVQLHKIPFTELKIDRAFVHSASDDSTASAILESSAELGRKLNMTIVAEGVEDQSDWNKSANAGCDLVQGYFIAKPMSADQFDIWVRQRQVAGGHK
ncbi:EAL domain-containing response regulator [Gynuella sunshinyii]|uniref:EAL domain n=1 Tax=Gynuella sunshinyii YC6258 TaxID=1445510 RepID=A0A0C5VL48_9GAMM|nr:EAL domain-containing response regulator [Gynuella sunshinyii]AJQ95036.1 EAL domain [Gynuella sunshinyii YC6258]